MDLRQMEFAVAVADESGFTAAARRLHVVQSAVSATVRALERELGTQLFDRTTHRVTLTPAGEAFVRAARATLEAAVRTRAAVDEVKGVLGGEVRIGMMQGIYAGLERALARFHHHHPGVVVRLRQAPAEDVREALVQGQIDLAVVALDRQQQRGLRTRLLSREEMVLVTSPNCELLKYDKVTLAEVARHPLVDFTRGWMIRYEVDRAFRRTSSERSTTFEVNDILAATDLVRGRLGVCILPTSLAGRFPDLTTRRFAQDAPYYELVVAWTHGKDSAAVSALLRHLA